jgi:hypothetical protein
MRLDIVTYIYFYVYAALYIACIICKKLALTSLTSGGRSVDIVRLRTEATELLLFLIGKASRNRSIASSSLVIIISDICYFL